MAMPELDFDPKDQKPVQPNSLAHALPSKKPEAWLFCSIKLSLPQDSEIRLRLASYLNPFTLIEEIMKLLYMATENKINQNIKQQIMETIPAIVHWVQCSFPFFFLRSFFPATVF